MYLSLEDKGSVFSILKNWPERRIKAICLTDGQSVGHLGDLGVQVGEAHFAGAIVAVVQGAMGWMCRT